MDRMPYHIGPRIPGPQIEGPHKVNIAADLVELVNIVISVGDNELCNLVRFIVYCIGFVSWWLYRQFAHDPSVPSITVCKIS